MTSSSIDLELIRLAESSRGELDRDFFQVRDFAQSRLEASVWPGLLAERGPWRESSARLVDACLHELRILMCTDDPKYSEVRRAGGGFSAACVPVVAGVVAASLGIATGVASAGVAFVALAVLEVGRNSLCRAWSLGPGNSQSP